MVLLEQSDMFLAPFIDMKNEKQLEDEGLESK